MTSDGIALRAEVNTAIGVEMQRVGLKGFDKFCVVRTFLHRGVGRSTLYRWIDAELATGKPSVHLAAKVKEAAKARSKRTRQPARAAAEEIVAGLPVVATVADIVAAEGGTIAVIDHLREILADAVRVINFSKTKEGEVRNPKLLLAALREARQCLETTGKLQEAMMQVAHIERFHTAIFDILRAESPLLVERVLVRMRQLNQKWGIAA